MDIIIIMNEKKYKTAKLILIGFIYFPMALILSLFCGSITGIILVTRGAYRNWRAELTNMLRQKKLHPKLSNVRWGKQYMDDLYQHDKTDPDPRKEISKYAHKKVLRYDFELGNLREPAIRKYVFHITFIRVGYLILLWWMMIFIGPIRFFYEMMDRWYEIIGKEFI